MSDRKTLERKRKTQRAVDRRRRDLAAAREQAAHEDAVRVGWMRLLVQRGVVTERAADTILQEKAHG